MDSDVPVDGTCTGSSNVESLGIIAKRTTIDNEPRILDTDLAANLGMARPRDIRANVISPNRTELEAFGVLRSMNAKSTDPLGRGRPTKSFYLNEEQALLVCLLSRTERAKAVRAEVIRVFTAYRRGDLVAASAPQLPNFMDPGEAAIRALRSRLQPNRR